MKKLTIALVALMVMSLGASAFAAELTVGATVDNSIEWNETDRWAGSNSVEDDLGLAGEDSNLSAHLGLKNTDEDTPFGLGQLEIDKAWIENQGAFWNGGPSLTTRLGSLDVKHSDLVATVKNNGASVDGLEIGDATIGGFMAWNNAMDAGVNVDYDFDLGNAKTTLVRSTAKDELAYAVECQVAPSDSMTIDAMYAGTTVGEDRSGIYQVEADLAASENTTISVGYRDLMDGVYGSFAPEYYNETKDGDNRTDIIGVAQGLGKEKADQNAGYNVGIETVQGDFTMSADYDNPRHEAKLGVNTELAGYKLGAETKFDEEDATFEYAQTKLTAEKDFALTGVDVNGKYTATMPKGGPVGHKLEAEAEVNAIEQLQGLGINGAVEFTNTDDVTWETGVEYTAPNGIELGAGYHSVDGANFNAGIKVEF